MKIEDGIKVTYVKEASITEIKTIIRKHVEKHGDFWPDELADKHNLSVWDTLTACYELDDEGYLKIKNKEKVPRKKRDGNKNEIC